MPRPAFRPALRPAAAREVVRPQLELFPEPVFIEPLDTRTIGGSGTRVRGVWKVRFGGETRGHRVFHDRHGWYCEEHGPTCRAVAIAKEQAAAD